MHYKKAALLRSSFVQKYADLMQTFYALAHVSLSAGISIKWRCMTIGNLKHQGDGSGACIKYSIGKYECLSGASLIYVCQHWAY